MVVVQLLLPVDVQPVFQHLCHAMPSPLGPSEASLRSHAKGIHWWHPHLALLIFAKLLRNHVRDEGLQKSEVNGCRTEVRKRHAGMAHTGGRGAAACTPGSRKQERHMQRAKAHSWGC